MKKRRQNLAWGAAIGAPPPLVRCTTTLVAVTGWEAESSKLPWGHRRCVPGGTATPRAVPTWTWSRLRRSEAGTGASGVHRRPKGGAPPGHLREGRCHRYFLLETGEMGLVTASGTATLSAVHHHKNPKRGYSSRRPSGHRHPRGGAAATLFSAPMTSF